MLALSRCSHSMEATEWMSLMSCLWDSSCHIQGCLCPPQGCRATSTHYKGSQIAFSWRRIQFWQGLNAHTGVHKVDASSFCMFLCLLFVCRMIFIPWMQMYAFGPLTHTNSWACMLSHKSCYCHGSYYDSLPTPHTSILCYQASVNFWMLRQMRTFRHNLTSKLTCPLYE